VNVDDEVIRISTDKLTFKISTKSGLILTNLHFSSDSPIVSSGDLFVFHTSKGVISGSTVDFVELVRKEIATGDIHHIFKTRHQYHNLEVNLNLITSQDSTLVEFWPEITNLDQIPISISRVDSLSLNFIGVPLKVHSYHAQGSCTEFTPVVRELSPGEGYSLESLSGRSSNGDHPYFEVKTMNGIEVAICVGWSGNWVARFEHQSDGEYKFSAGLHDQGFTKVLPQKNKLVAPPVVISFAENDANKNSNQFHETGRKRWYPPTPEGFPPTEWNHWWPYIDQFIDQETFLANVDVAADLGLEICTLDAGWYGSPNRESNWYETRGDWDHVNTDRFPSGVRTLSDYAHDKGLMFGLWCEIEALGKKSQFAANFPQLPAIRDGECLGYLCLGNPEARRIALSILERLISEYSCDWIKIDFNIDPGLGCNRTDHGHDFGDGLFEHYMGLYEVLEKISEKFPKVLLENCSSGSLRIDLGMAKRTHIAYLSDPDWPEHSLQVAWAALGWLSPERVLHWVYSEWRDKNALPLQKFDPSDPSLTRKKIMYYSRISMLHGFGLSQRLPDLPHWILEIFRENIWQYKEVIRPHISKSRILKLTGQTLREGRGDRWAAFQYKTANDDHLLFVFRSKGAEHERRIKMEQVQPGGFYKVIDLDQDLTIEFTGQQLLNGIDFKDLLEEDSKLLQIKPIN
jgi:alpha-galactosidase